MKKNKIKFLYRQIQIMRNVLAMLALFVCTSICLGDPQTIIVDRAIPRDWDYVTRTVAVYHEIAGNGDLPYGIKPYDGWKDPKGNRLIINSSAVVGSAYGAYMNNVRLNARDKGFILMTNNEVKVNDGDFTEGEIAGAFAANYIDKLMEVSSNTVKIKGGNRINNVYGGRTYFGTVSSNTVTIDGGVTIQHYVYGGYIEQKGTATENKVNLTDVDVNRDVYGAWIRDGYASSNKVIVKGGIIGIVWFGIENGNVYGGYIHNNGTVTLNTVDLTSVTVRQDVFGAWICDGLASSNEVTIDEGSRIKGNVYGGYIFNYGTATVNKVNLTGVTVSSNVYGGYVLDGYDSSKNAFVISNEVTIKGGIIGVDDAGGNVYGGYIEQKGTATENKVNMTGVTVSSNVYGAWVRDGYASSNEVTIDEGSRIKGNVYGGYVLNGTATENKVTINGGEIEGAVYGGYVSSGRTSANTVIINGGEIKGGIFGDTISDNRVKINGGKIGGVILGGTITINGSPVFSPAAVLLGSVLNIETKGVEVGIGNFEDYKFHLKDIKTGEIILTVTSGGCSRDTDEMDYSTDCAVDLTRSNIYLHTEGVLNKDDYYILIKSPQGFKDNGEYKTFVCTNVGLVKYDWKIKMQNESELIAILTGKKVEEEKTKPLLEGYGAGLACTNNGMDCILSKMEEGDSIIGEREGEVGVFYGIEANKSKYKTGSHIDMIGMSMMGGIGKVVGVRGKELTTGAFVECGSGDSDIHCEKKSKGASKYGGVGVLGRCNWYEDENSGAKAYGEVVLRAGRVMNSFKGKEVKGKADKELEYDDADAMYGGGEVGVGYKHKVSEHIDLDWSLRYMLGYQGGKDVVERTEKRTVEFDNVFSNRIRVGVRGKYVELGKVKPYAGIRYEYELSGEVKAVTQDSKDELKIPESSFGGGSVIGEAGASVKVWKLDVDISMQKYMGVREGFGGMLKVKYAFGGKDAYARP